jgi:hypothetical protein
MWNKIKSFFGKLTESSNFLLTLQSLLTSFFLWLERKEMDDLKQEMYKSAREGDQKALEAQKIFLEKCKQNEKELMNKIEEIKKKKLKNHQTIDPNNPPPNITVAILFCLMFFSCTTKYIIKDRLVYPDIPEYIQPSCEEILPVTMTYNEIDKIYQVSVSDAQILINNKENNKECIDMYRNIYNAYDNFREFYYSEKEKNEKEDLKENK